jgi:hypothetical protein
VSSFWGAVQEIVDSKAIIAAEIERKWEEAKEYEEDNSN